MDINKASYMLKVCLSLFSFFSCSQLLSFNGVNMESPMVIAETIKEKELMSLFEAIVKGDLEKVRNIVEKPENKQDNFENIVFDTCKYSRKYKELTHKDIYISGCRPICIAAMVGDLNIIKYLIEDRNVDLNSENTDSKDTTVFIAARNGHFDIVDYFLSKGVDVNAKNLIKLDEKTLLEIAIQSEKFDAVKLLVERGAIISVNNLVLAIYVGSVDIVNYFLLKGNFDINVKSEWYYSFGWHDFRGETLLDIAIGREKFDIVKLLVENGAIISTENLILAVYVGSVDIVNYFLSHRNVDINSKLVSSESYLYAKTALGMAIDRGKFDIVKILVEHGAVILKQDLYEAFQNKSCFYKKDEVDECGKSDIKKSLLEKKLKLKEKEIKNLKKEFCKRKYNCGKVENKNEFEAIFNYLIRAVKFELIGGFDEVKIADNYLIKTMKLELNCVNGEEKVDIIFEGRYDNGNFKIFEGTMEKSFFIDDFFNEDAILDESLMVEMRDKGAEKKKAFKPFLSLRDAMAERRKSMEGLCCLEDEKKQGQKNEIKLIEKKTVKLEVKNLEKEEEELKAPDIEKEFLKILSKKHDLVDSITKTNKSLSEEIKEGKVLKKTNYGKTCEEERRAKEEQCKKERAKKIQDAIKIKKSIKKNHLMNEDQW